MKLLSQRCLLCSTVGVKYVKTEGGFHKVCESCEKVLDAAGLLVPSEVVYLMGDKEGA